MSSPAVSTLSERFDPEIRKFVSEHLPFALPPKHATALDVTVDLSSVFVTTLNFESTFVTLVEGHGVNVTM